MKLAKEGLYHFDSIFLIPVTVFPNRFPHRNSKKRYYETNIIPYLATLENSWEKLIIRANFWVIWGLMATWPKNLHSLWVFSSLIFPKSRSWEMINSTDKTPGHSDGMEFTKVGGELTKWPTLYHMVYLASKIKKVMSCHYDGSKFSNNFRLRLF